MNPATLVLPSSKSRTLDGGNLARVLYDAPSASAGHPLFTEQFKKLLRQITDTARVARCIGSDSAPAASPHGSVSRRVPQALPFREVNNFTHIRLSRCETLFNKSAIA